MKVVSRERISLRKWIWKAFASTSLLPLVLVEGVLITAYFVTNHAMRNSQIEHLHRSAVRDVQGSVQQNALLVQGQLEQISKTVSLYAKSIENELVESYFPVEAKLALSPDGVRYSAVDDELPASFYSNIRPPEKQDLYKISRLANLDFMMKELKDQDPLIASIYFNSWDSYNRIYPWFNTLQQYPHDMDITQYNFYYLADAQHNPKREVVWTDVYLDPAGNGWLMSSVAPVYSEGKLEGVAGVDLTVDGILKRIEKLEVPWEGYLMLVSDKLDVMAVPPAGERDFSLRTLQKPALGEAVNRERLQSADFNLASRANLVPLTKTLPNTKKGIVSVTLNGRPHLIAWSDIPSTGWHLLAVVDEAAVMHETNMLATYYRDVGYLMVAGLVVFYALFFAFMWRRTRHLSHELYAPVLGISRMMREIGKGNWRPVACTSDIAELQFMSNRAMGMGAQLAQAERIRRSTQQRLELVIESVAEGLWEYSPTSRRLILKGALRWRFGFSSNEVPIELLLEKIYTEDREPFTRFLAAAEGRESTSLEVEFRITDVDGELIWILCRGRTLEPSPTADLNVVVGACVDITTLKRTQLDLRDKTVEAESASSAKSKFISSMSHELRTPLNAIYGFAQLSVMQLPAGETQHAGNLHEIIEASEHLMQLVDDLLDLSSLQAEEPKLTLKPMNVANLLRNCADMVQQQVADHGQTLLIDASTESWEVRADNRRLKQVLINLLSNALKYNRPGGTITLGAKAIDGEQRLRLYVTDTGMGISPVLQRELFVPFQRLGKENSSIQGTGIGLALCRELAELMGGAMGLESEVGRGSTFWIDLNAATHSSNVGSVLRLPRVLLVSDNVHDCQSVHQALAGHAELEVVSTLLQAENIIKYSSIHVMILATQDPQEVFEVFIKNLRLNFGAGSMSIVVVAPAVHENLMEVLDCQAILTSPLEIICVRSVILAFTMGVEDLCFQG